MDPASRASQAIEEGLYARPKSLWSSTTEEMEIEPLDTMSGGIKGYVYSTCCYSHCIFSRCFKMCGFKE